MKIVLIGYKKNSGKDTVKDYIMDKYGDVFYHTSFAKHIRELIIKLLKLKDIDELEKLKREDDSLYRHYATTLGKTLNHDIKDGLLNLTIDEIKNKDFVLISDFRLVKEYERLVKEFGKNNVYTINIKRHNINDDTSYTNINLDSFNFDYVIENIYTLDKLKDNSLKIIEEILA